MFKKALFVVAAFGGLAYGACFGPYCFDDTGAAIQGGIGITSASFTVSTSTPSRVGQIILDSNYKLYVSTCTNFAGSNCWIQPKNQ